jgi:hypothetical protein
MRGSRLEAPLFLSRGFHVMRRCQEMTLPIAKLSFRTERALALTDQLHTSTLRPGTFEKCLRLFVTTVIPWETACEAMRRSIFRIGLP